MLAANPIFPRPTFSASSARLPSTSGLCLSSCSSAPPRSVGCQLSAVSSPASPFPAALSGKSQLIENPAALSPVLATLTRRVNHNPFVCRSYKKHPGGGPFQHRMDLDAPHPVSLIEPHPLTPSSPFLPPVMSHQLAPASSGSQITKSFRIRTSEKPTRNPFRIRTSRTQHLKPFRMNTSKKNRVGAPPSPLHAPTSSSPRNREPQAASRESPPSGSQVLLHRFQQSAKI